MAFELKGEGFKLKDALVVVGIPEATYHYHVQQFKTEDPDKELRKSFKLYLRSMKGNMGIVVSI